MLSRGENAFLDQPSPELNAKIEIDFHDADGGPALRRQAHQHRPVPEEVTRPLVTAGIEQRNDLPGPGIDAGNVRPLVAIARETA